MRSESATSRTQRSVALPITGGLASSLIWIPALISSGAEPGEWVAPIYFLLIGAAVSAVIGLPILFAVDCFLATKWRYVIDGGAYGLVFWTLMDAPIFPKDWHMLLESSFWIDYAPRRVAIWISFGMLVGVAYTGIVWVLGAANLQMRRRSRWLKCMVLNRKDADRDDCARNGSK